MSSPVSVYRVGGEGADPSHVFGDGVRDVGLSHAAWLGWLPLVTADFAGPDLAVAEDRWLTAPPGRSRSGRVRPGELVSAVDAAGELLARRACGLDAYALRREDVSADGRLRSSSVADSVAEDLAAQVARVRSAHEAWVESVGAADRELEVADGCECRLTDDSPVRRRCARAVRDLREHHLRLQALLEAVVRIGVFDPAAAGRRVEVADASSTP